MIEPSDRPSDVPGKVVAALDRIARGQRSHRQRAATDHGLSPLQAELILTLHAGAPPEPLIGRLARELAVSQPTITDSVRVLEAKELLVRRADPADRRRSLVVLTPAGSSLADDLQRAGRDVSEAVAALGTAEQESVLVGLLDVIASMVDHDVIDVARTCTTCTHHELRTDGTHHCHLLGTDLPVASLRVNCPEHLERVSAA